MRILKRAAFSVGIIALISVPAMAQTTYPDSVSVFTDAKNLVKSRTFVGNGTFAMDTTTGDAYEGKKCVKYSYDLKGMYWDGFGLNIGNVNATGTTALRIAYKGPAGGPTLNITLIDKAGGTSQLTGLMEVTEWTLGDYNLTDFTYGTDTVTGMSKPADFAQIASIRFDIMSGAPNGTGDLFIDDIWFMGGTLGAGVRNGLHSPAASTSLLTKSSGTVVTTVCGLDGSVLYRAEQKAAANQAISLQSAQNRLASGMYVLTVKGAGINLSRPITRQ